MKTITLIAFALIMKEVNISFSVQSITFSRNWLDAETPPDFNNDGTYALNSDYPIWFTETYDLTYPIIRR